MKLIGDATLHTGDALAVLCNLPDESVQTCITSPPYFGLRDYGVDGQLGLESTIEEYVDKMVVLFREVRRALKDDGTLWLNMGDGYASNGGSGWQGKNGQRANRGFTAQNCRRDIPRYAEHIGLKPKDLIGMPWRLAFALQADGWYLRQDIIWHKPNPMPESVKDRCTKAHEYIFLLSGSTRYFYDNEAISEGRAYSYDKPCGSWATGNVPHDAVSHNKPNDGNQKYNYGEKTTTKKEAAERRNKRSVWTVGTKAFAGAHFATFPPDLIRPCVLAGAPPGGVVLDPFSGSGTTGMVAPEEGRKYIGIELNPDYQELAIERITPASKQGRLIA